MLHRDQLKIEIKVEAARGFARKVYGRFSLPTPAGTQRKD